MTTESHPIDARPSLSLIAAFVLIVGLGVLALTAQLRFQSMQPASTDAVAEFLD